jgi:hypothetical protein
MNVLPIAIVPIPLADWLERLEDSLDKLDSLEILDESLDKLDSLDRLD